MSDHLVTLGKGGAGVLGSIWGVLAAVTHLQEQIAWFLGILVAVTTIYSAYLDILKKRRSLVPPINPKAFTKLCLEDNGDETFTLEHDLAYTGDQFTVTVPAGFRTDFASVPRIFWSIIAPYGAHGRASIVHDFMYATGGLGGKHSRSDCDQIFLQAMRDSGVTPLRRGAMWLAVRIAGWLFFCKP